MHERAAIFRDGAVNPDRALDLQQQVQEHLAEFSTLAFRVAYGVLRHHQDAEDVAQEAIARAYQRLGSLRDTERLPIP